MPTRYVPPLERIEAKIERITETGCWIWIGSLGHHGYARFSLDDKTRLVHRVIYELLVGPIPEGMHLDHLCRVRCCVNPAHLEAVTCRENLMRGETPARRNAEKTHCVNGHLLDEKNTYRPPSRPEKRQCRACVSIRLKVRGAV